jgi:hypothetical protein
LPGLIDMIDAITGRPLGYARQGTRPGDVPDSLARLDRAEQLLGYPLVHLAGGRLASDLDVVSRQFRRARSRLRGLSQRACS